MATSCLCVLALATATATSRRAEWLPVLRRQPARPLQPSPRRRNKSSSETVRTADEGRTRLFQQEHFLRNTGSTSPFFFRLVLFFQTQLPSKLRGIGSSTAPEADRGQHPRAPFLARPPNTDAARSSLSQRHPVPNGSIGIQISGRPDRLTLCRPRKN